MTYEIRENAQYNSLEVYFDGKPAAAVRGALKALKMRWNPTKSCWYGFASEGSIADAILTATPADEPSTIYGDGYLGGGSVYGSKSHQMLFGADLSAAIRTDIKAAGIKGVSVRCQSYSGGQHITATVTIKPSDLVSYEDYEATYSLPGSGWIYTADGDIFAERIWAAPNEERERVRKAAAAYEWEKYTAHEQDAHLRRAAWLTPEAKARLERVDAIISAYRYDSSNGMVDYFDTNFYYTIRTKPAR